MKNRYLLLVLLAVACITAHSQQIQAFPGAEGHGRYTTGGRGGTVIHVTNLNDSGTGSLRAAVSGSSKKIIVFDVGGVIPLQSDLSIGENTTIAGQTAPWPGITLRYYTVRPGANNIIRFIRIRRGQEKDVDDGADAFWQRQKTLMMLDHCSFSWSIDEVASFYDNNNFTMQWCTVGESLVNAGHDKGAHGYGGIWGGKLASFHHNMILHVANRSPRFNGARYNWTGYTGNKLYSQYNWANAVQAENVDFRNCVIYNCGNGCYGGPGGGQINIVNNYYKSGPSKTTSRITQVDVGSSDNSKDYETYWGMSSRYYIDGNQLNSYTDDNWNHVSYSGTTYQQNGQHYSSDTNNYYGDAVEHTTIDGVSCVRIKMDEPTYTGEVTTHTAAKAFEKVLSYAGASLDRDEVDERYVQEAQNGTATYTGSVTKKPGLVDVVSDVNGYTEENFGTGSRESGYDSDNDGMPDVWETANGLDPNSAADAKQYTLDSNGWYTNLEVYLNSIVEDIMKAGQADGNDAVDEYYPKWTDTEGVVHNGTGEIEDPEDPPQDPEDPEDPETPDTSNSFLIDNTTYSSSSEDGFTWYFNNDFTVSNAGGKAYATGKNNRVKYSSDVQYTITIPDGVYVEDITFTGYDNYDTADSYISELHATGLSYNYGSMSFLFPSTKEEQSYTIVFDAPVTGNITFTLSGKQTVLSLSMTKYVIANKVSGSITWPFDLGTDSQQANFDITIEGGFASNSVTVGSYLSIIGKDTTSGGDTETKVQPSTKTSSANEASTIFFNATPAEGFSFQPTSVSITASRYGTNGGYMDIAWMDGDNATTLASKQTPERNKDESNGTSHSPYATTYTFDTGFPAEPTSNTFGLKVYIYNLDVSKQYGLCNIIINGVLTKPNGTTEEVTTTFIEKPRAAVSSDVYVTLSGQHTKQPVRGIYIRNGKKVIVR